jgi:hypothetical protein
MSQNLFASVIKALLDDTNLFNRKEWAQFLGVSESAISQWVGNKTIPRPDLLYMMVDVLEQSTGITKGPLEAFKAMAHKPGTDVSPHGRRMLPTVWAYMTRPAFSELSSTLAKLSPEEQAKLLFEQYGTVKPTTKTGMTVPENGQLAAATKQSAEVSIKSLDMSPPLGAASPVIGCARADGAISCFAWEASPWKGIIAPRFRFVGSGGTNKLEDRTCNWEEVSQHPHVLFVASPGTGKTSFLVHLARSGWSLPENQEVRTLYFHLGCLSSVQTTGDFQTMCRKLVPYDFDVGRTVFLLDGFDEVPAENRHRLADAILGFQRSNPKTRLAISSRPSPDLSAFARMTWLEMEPPSPDRLIAWVQQEVPERSVERERWQESIQTFVASLKERPDVFKELQNPLLLSHCTKLSMRHSLTANNDVEMFQGCLRLLLDEWDEKKNIVRAANVWARPRHLYQLLSVICYHTLTEQRGEFTSDDVESWCHKYSSSAPLDEILRILSETSGIVRPSGDRKWIIAHATFQEYLAAIYIIDSSSEATSLVKEWLHGPRISNVLKFASAATSDASDLFEFAMRAKWPRPDDRMVTLAEMIAQQPKADTDLIKRGCEELTKWLNSSFAGWETTTVEDSDQISPPKWKLAARKTSRQSTPGSQNLLRTLRAVHRTRSSPAKDELSDRLKASRNNVVRAVGDSMDVDGYLQARMIPHKRNAVLVAEVFAT